MTAEYELFALRYATRKAQRHEHFIGGDPHDGPMPMDYFVWLARNQDRAVVIDIGFTAESGGKRGRILERCPIDSLALLDVDPATVQDVILTHMHYDHVGNFHKFPTARFHLQEPEIHYATGRYMRFKQLAKSFEPDDVCGIVRLNFDGRVTYHNGPADILPGIDPLRHRTLYAFQATGEKLRTRRRLRHCAPELRWPRHLSQRPSRHIAGYRSITPPDAICVSSNWRKASNPTTSAALCA